VRLVPRPEDPLDQFLGEVRSELQARADRGGRVRDFADVMSRARRIDPEVTGAAAVREAARYAPVVALPGSRARVTAARPGRSRVGSLLGLAAALLVGVALGTSVREARRDGGVAPAHAVQLAAEGAAREVAAVRDEPPVRREVRAGESRVEPEGAASEVSGEVTASEGEVMRGVRGEEPSEHGEETRGVRDTEMRGARGEEASLARDRGAGEEASLARDRGADEEASLARDRGVGEDEYLRIDREADVAWRRGDRRRARALLERLTRSGAPERLVEAAYGDLGVLIRQEGDERGLARLWRRYLARFPRGTFADDARAELCRGAEEPATCWDRYLRSSPRGAHIEEGRRAVGEIDGELVMSGAPDVTPVQAPALRAKE
jgi:hypothetical protein